MLRDQPALASAYLLSHRDNPVDWWSWGDDAFDEARRRGVPVFLSVGYAACHWCHVMAHESFENPVVGAQLNRDFVAIKVDREERPDVDQVYMAATQLLSGHGGWPMSVFILPDGRPFTAGTYYPPEDRGGQVGFGRLLDAIASAWRERYDDIVDQANALERALRREVAFVDALAPRVDSLDLASVRHLLAQEIADATDSHGGQGAPRFPRPSFVRALLQAGRSDVAETILRAMAFEGLYDHIEGGFARYSVDASWHVPHFEQMLSDQALLTLAYAEAAVRNGRREWHEVAMATAQRIRDAFSVSTGFASALDADAGGHEGSHVTWTVEEVRAALERAGCPDDVAAALERWRITTPGLFEGRSIPRLNSGAPFLTPPALAKARRGLQVTRATRPQPVRDEKVVLEFNAMTARAFLSLGDDEFTTDALVLLRSLETTHLRHDTWWRTSECHVHATAADLSWFLDATIDAFERTGDDTWRRLARRVSNYLIAHHWDGAVPTAMNSSVGHGLFATSDAVTDLFVRPKEIFDGATPSSHAIATRALARLALIDGDGDVLAVAQRLVTLANELLSTHPRSVVDLVDAAGFALEGVEIVIPGAPSALADHVRLHPVSNAVLITGNGTSPLLAGRRDGVAYVCRRGVCQTPVSSVDDLEHLLGPLR